MIPEKYDQTAIQDEIDNLKEEIRLIRLRTQFNKDTVQLLSATGTANQEAMWVIVDASGGAVTVTIPLVADRRRISITKSETSANAVTVVEPNGANIQGAASLVLGGGARATVDLYSTETEYLIV